MAKGVVVVTGGDRGIGAAVVRAVAAAGWTVCLTYHSNKEAAAAVCDEVRAAGGVAEAVQADVAVEADVRAVFAAADALGPVTALVANAGIVAETARVDEMDAARIQRLFSVNVLGPFLCCGEAVRRMSTRYGGSGGAIVLMSSSSSRSGSPGTYVDYAASNGALDTLGTGLAKEVVGEGIRVNTVRPGVIDTDIHADSGRPDRVDDVGESLPMGRAGQPEEVAAVVLWLLGDASSYVTGSILDVTGGT